MSDTGEFHEREITHYLGDAARLSGDQKDETLGPSLPRRRKPFPLILTHQP